MLEQEKKTVVLTGASRGIGHATVKKFSENGWQVVSCSRDDIPDHCRRDPNWSFHYPTDLGKPENVSLFIEKVLEGLNGRPIHALVNNAALSPKTPEKGRKGCLDTELEEWKDVFNLNFFAPLKLVKGLLPALEQTESSIVNITSIAGHSVHPFAGSAYSTSKAALSALTRELAVELAGKSIRVNAIAPGEIQTEMIGPEYNQLLTKIPMGRFGTSEEVANIVFEFCQKKFSYITGTEIFVTGGQHL